MMIESLKGARVYSPCSDSLLDKCFTDYGRVLKIDSKAADVYIIRNTNRLTITKRALGKDKLLIDLKSNTFI